MPNDPRVTEQLNRTWRVPLLVDDPLLTELWIVAMCGLLNDVTPRIHADVAEAAAGNARALA